MDRIWTALLGTFAAASIGCSATHDVDGLSKDYSAGAGGHGGHASGSTTGHGGHASGSTTGHGGAGGGGGVGGAAASTATVAASTTSMASTTATGPACGENGIACCAGPTCNNAGLACNLMTQMCETCGGPHELCCGCPGGYACDPASGRCELCGALGQICCAGNACDNPAGWLECRGDNGALPPAANLRCQACCANCQHDPSLEACYLGQNGNPNNHKSCADAAQQRCNAVNNCPGGPGCCATGCDSNHSWCTNPNANFP